MKKLKNRLIVNVTSIFRKLNIEILLGFVFLIPPTWGVVIFVLNIFGANIGFDSFPDNWNCIVDSWKHEQYSELTGETEYTGGAYGYAATPAIPIYLGLMAIAGAYLIKGNFSKKE